MAQERISREDVRAALRARFERCLRDDLPFPEKPRAEHLYIAAEGDGALALLVMLDYMTLMDEFIARRRFAHFLREHALAAA